VPKNKYPGKRVTTNGNQLVAYTEASIADCGVFYPITPSTEQGEHFEMSVSEGNLTVFGDAVKAIEAEGEHAAQGGAIAMSVTGKRVSNFTSGQGIVYGLEQYYHAPGKLSTMVLNVGARALTKHALNVHCGHDDIMAAIDTGWTMVMAKDAQQAVDQTIILRKVTELSLTPGMNIQDGFLTTHLQRTFLKPEAELIREFIGHPNDTIDCPNKAQEELFGKTRRRVPEMYNLKRPILLGSVQNQEHYMTGLISRGTTFHDPILDFIEDAMKEYGDLTGRHYGLLSEYNCDKSDTVFLALGSAAENLEAVSDYIKNEYGEELGIIHLNVIRPFPTNAVIKALKGKKNVVIFERTDEPNSVSNPIARDVRSALSKAIENSRGNYHEGIESLKESEAPRIFESVYGLGSRDFRPEHGIGAYEFVTERRARQDGKKASEGASFFYLGVNHDYAVVSDQKPSLLPENAIAVRIHSIGGWGAITTGKNMAEIMGNLSSVSKHAKDGDEEVIHISANPKYGSEKKGAPTNYFLVCARERIRVNCDLQHVDVVLCCDPKIFTHTNPLNGLRDGGNFIWESELSPEEVWSRIPKKYREIIIKKKIKLKTLSGFEIARNNTPNESLQTRMQGNSFLGAFFKVSPFLQDHGIDDKIFLDMVYKQYEKKFGRFGDAVVEGNMSVMKQGFEGLKDIEYGKIEDADLSDMKGKIISPSSCSTCAPEPSSNAELPPPVFQFDNYKEQFLEGSMDDQKATPLTSIGLIPAATGADNSKFVSRIKTPLYNPYNCTQCMACITVCPDTALPNTSQDISTVIKSTFENYVDSKKDKELLLGQLDTVTEKVRARMNEDIAAKKSPVTPFDELVYDEIKAIGISEDTRSHLGALMKMLPLGYGKARTTFQMLEKQKPGEGGLFTIFVSDLCKGCGECVEACGDHNALTMENENDELRGEHLTQMEFLDTLPQTPKKYLGKFDEENMEETRAAILHNHLMIQDSYKALVSGDGSCAGCGEKSVLRGAVTITETLMRPIFKTKAQRLENLAEALKNNGVAALDKIQKDTPETFANIKLAICHTIMGLGAENTKSSMERIEANFKGTNADLIDALKVVIETDSINHQQFKVIDGKFQGMNAMGMTASTGCNTVYGSTHPSNPHPYPWMNSLFQDGPTIGWLVAESFTANHAKRSVIPERIANMVLQGETDFSNDDYEEMTHFDDAQMTEKEIREMPKVWIIGGDGALGDIGFQNLSKVVLQNRPNVQILMLDTQVYSNTGGQNSDSSVMPGGFDMNQFGKYHEGKLVERKELAQIFTSGHGSPFVANVSMANAPKFFQAVLDGLLYRGTCFIQSFTTCQPEHGVGDDTSQKQAILIRDTRGMPEFTFAPEKGETWKDLFDLKGNPRLARDWGAKKDADKNEYDLTIPQWAVTEGRFRKHFYKIKDDQKVVRFEDLILRLTQNDIINRRYLLKDHRSHVPKMGIYVDIIDESGKRKVMGVSRQLVLFTVERRKNWRLLQGRAGLENKDHVAQVNMLNAFDSGELPKEEFFGDTQAAHKKFLS
jgi:pyruvate-ferredoxin/flavodoxin oxidoreductase